MEHKMLIGGGYIGTTRASFYGSLHAGELWLHYGASNVHDAGAEEPSECGGQLQWPLPRGGVCTLLLRYPDQQVRVGP